MRSFLFFDADSTLRRNAFPSPRLYVGPMRTIELRVCPHSLIALFLSLVNLRIVIIYEKSSKLLQHSNNLTLGRQ
jgi:hypothetical protein